MLIHQYWYPVKLALDSSDAETSTWVLSGVSPNTWEEAADILPVAVLDFLSLLVFLVVFVSVFLVFVLVFMFVRVYDAKERSTCSAAFKGQQGNCTYIFRRPFRLLELGCVSVQADRGNKRHSQFFFYMLPDFCPSVSCITPPTNPLRCSHHLHATGNTCMVLMEMEFPSLKKRNLTVDRNLFYLPKDCNYWWFSSADYFPA